MTSVAVALAVTIDVDHGVRLLVEAMAEEVACIIGLWVCVVMLRSSKLWYVKTAGAVRVFTSALSMSVSVSVTTRRMNMPTSYLWEEER